MIWWSGKSHHMIEKIYVLLKLVLRLEHLPKKNSTTLVRCHIFVGSGLTKIAATSAYKDQCSWAAFLTLVSIWLIYPLSQWSFGGSITSMKSPGGNGSPCHRPLSCLICWHSSTFTIGVFGSNGLNFSSITLDICLLIRSVKYSLITNHLCVWGLNNNTIISPWFKLWINYA